MEINAKIVQNILATQAVVIYLPDKNMYLKKINKKTIAVTSALYLAKMYHNIDEDKVLDNDLYLLSENGLRTEKITVKIEGD